MLTWCYLLHFFLFHFLVVFINHNICRFSSVALVSCLPLYFSWVVILVFQCVFYFISHFMQFLFSFNLIVYKQIIANVINCLVCIYMRFLQSNLKKWREILLDFFCIFFFHFGLVPPFFNSIYFFSRLRTIELKDKCISSVKVANVQNCVRPAELIRSGQTDTIERPNLRTWHSDANIRSVRTARTALVRPIGSCPAVWIFHGVRLSGLCSDGRTVLFGLSIRLPSPQQWCKLWSFVAFAEVWKSRKAHIICVLLCHLNVDI